jgi:8-hydroxy-5-deazaflavin:NADPH oxidoreductase
MKIGIIGAGAIGKAFARHTALAGYEVVIANSRGPESLADLVKEIGHGIKAVTVAEVIHADIIFLAVNWKQVPQVVEAPEQWKGKIVIDPTNAIAFPQFKPIDLGDRTSSEIIQQLIPEARVVKAFNTLPAAILAANPKENNGRRVIFISGNDDAAKTVVKEIIDRTGFASVDLGELSTGGRLQQFGGPLPTLNLLKL